MRKKASKQPSKSREELVEEMTNCAMRLLAKLSPAEREGRICAMEKALDMALSRQKRTVQR